MTTYYVGKGGSDSANGLTWDNRKLTLNGAEDIPVVANDTVYVGPGTYREELVADVNGSLGSPITYIGDIHGVYTDEIGGAVRISGSENDKVSSRNNCIAAEGDYRVFRGLRLENSNYTLLDVDTNVNTVTIEDCVFGSTETLYQYGIRTGSNTSGDIIIRRCYIQNSSSLYLNSSSADLTVENCIIHSGISVGGTHTGTEIIRNCLLTGPATGINFIGTTIASFDINNCLIIGFSTGINGVTNVSEDYNSFIDCTNDVVGITGGANSDNYPALFHRPPLAEGYPREFFPYVPASYSPLARIAGTSEPTDDFFGITRPTTSGKKSRGPVQVVDVVLATSPLYGTTTESLETPDAGRYQVRIPVTATSTTISVRTYREANYAGTLPQMVIKEAGQSDRTTTDTGSASTWNLLTDTFTPNGAAGFVVIEIVSNNTATSGSYSSFWSELKVAA